MGLSLISRYWGTPNLWKPPYVSIPMYTIISHTHLTSTLCDFALENPRLAILFDPDAALRPCGPTFLGGPSPEMSDLATESTDSSWTGQFTTKEGPAIHSNHFQPTCETQGGGKPPGFFVEFHPINTYQLYACFIAINPSLS